MILHGLLTITALAITAIAGFLPAKRVEVPPPKPIPFFTESIFDFVVTNFEAQAVVLSDRTYISFHLRPYPGAATLHCFALGTTLTHSLTSIPQTWCYPSHNDTDSDTDQFPPANEPPSPESDTDHVWFSWTIGADVDMTDPTADGVFGMDRQTGAYLKVVRQVDAHTRDEAVQHVPWWYMEVKGSGMLTHEVYVGPVNFTLAGLRFIDTVH